MHTPTAIHNIRRPKVRKRDGAEVPFEAARIESAVLRAGRASGEFDQAEAALLTAQVLKVIDHRSPDWTAIVLEEIQNIVEQVLISANHLDTARAYIAYRDRHRQLRPNWFCPH